MELKAQRMVIDLLDYTKNARETYGAKRASTQEKFEAGLITAKGYEDSLKDLHEEFENGMSDRKSKALQQMDYEQEDVNDLLGERVESLSIEDTTILNFLATVEGLTHSELQSYQNKYIHNPIALKKIQEIAKSKEIVLNAVVDEHEEISKYYQLLSDCSIDAVRLAMKFDGTQASSFFAFKESMVNQIEERTNQVKEILNNK